MNPMVTTALTSAAVAALITLLLEYAAKPRLEVRKERILEVDRSRRQLVECLWQMASRLSLLLSLGTARLEDVRSVLKDEVGRMEADADRLRDVLVQSRVSLFEDLAYVTSAALGTITARCDQLASTLEGSLRFAEGATVDSVVDPSATDLEWAERDLKAVAEILEVGLLRLPRRVAALRHVRSRASEIRIQHAKEDPIPSNAI